MVIIIILSLGIVTAIVLYLYLGKRGFKNRVLSAFEQLSATTNLENAQVQRLPGLALTGTYRTLDITVECSPIKVGGRRREGWRFWSTLPVPSACKFYVQGEGREGRLTKVVDLDLVTTGDALFDAQVLIFASCREGAKKVWSPYLRQRCLSLGLKDFSMEISGDEASFELNLEPLASMRQVRHALEFWTEFLNIASVI
jgi:hypothetical protein